MCRMKAKKNWRPAYRYFSPALLVEGTDFNRYLAALSAGRVIFDPGSKVMNASTEKSTVKARSQFRMVGAASGRALSKVRASEVLSKCARLESFLRMHPEVVSR